MDNDTQDPTTSPDASHRRLGGLLRSVDHLLSHAFAEALAGEGVDRRDWMLLNVLSGEHSGHGEQADRVAAFAQRKGKRMRALADRGWVAREADGTWTLTDAGRAERDRLGGIVDGIRSRVADAVPPDEYATMVASLEAIARELGGDDASPWTRPTGRGIRHGGNRHHGFGPGHGFAPGHGPHHGHRHGHRTDRRVERAFERGFDSGFRRGRDA
ncbi:hypothetical protein GCM10022200_22100 [Microbacterium awajiense]|uniref:MarR family transcriptional regulator n=1 Tax=Microbacterium awajiense TaxID=415214 RepID=A0ABP7ARB8_9MICO